MIASNMRTFCMSTVAALSIVGIANAATVTNEGVAGIDSASQSTLNDDEQGKFINNIFDEVFLGNRIVKVNIDLPRRMESVKFDDPATAPATPDEALDAVGINPSKTKNLELSLRDLGTLVIGLNTETTVEVSEDAVFIGDLDDFTNLIVLQGRVEVTNLTTEESVLTQKLSIVPLPPAALLFATPVVGLAAWRRWAAAR